MDISIIIPAYNGEKTIEKCINSLLPQLDDSVEIIIVNDGSKDRTAEICQGYLCDNIRLLNQENCGVSSARNAGIAAARGKHFTFIDCDDYVGEDYIKILKESVIGSPELVVFNRINFVTPKGDKISELTAGLTPAEKLDIRALYPSFISQNTNSVYTKIFRSDIAQANQLQFGGKIAVSEDYLFIMNYICACKTFKSVDLLPYFFVFNPFGTYIPKASHLKGLLTAYTETAAFIESNCSDLNTEPSKSRFIQQLVEVAGKLKKSDLLSAELEQELTESLAYRELTEFEFTKFKSKIEKYILKNKKWKMGFAFFRLVKILEKVRNYVK